MRNANDSFFKPDLKGPFLIVYGNGLFLAAWPAKPKRTGRFRQTEYLSRSILGPVTGSGLNDPARPGAIACVEHPQLSAHRVRVVRRTLQHDAKPSFRTAVHIQLRRTVIL